jgi:hypothetical protein
LIPFNVMATDKLNLPYLNHNDVCCTSYTFPAYSPSVQLKAANRISINRAILNLITVRHLRAAHIFQFKDGSTEWTVYDSKENPLEQHEVRGSVVWAIQQVKSHSASALSPVSIDSQSFVHSTKPIIRKLESFSPDDKVFIILVFKDCAIATGNYFDETALCRALLNFSPRMTDKVIRQVKSDILNSLK